MTDDLERPMPAAEFDSCLRTLGLGVRPLATLIEMNHRTVLRFRVNGVPLELRRWLRVECAAIEAGAARPSFSAWLNRRTANPPPRAPLTMPPRQLAAAA